MTYHSDRWTALGALVTATVRADGRTIGEIAIDCDVSTKFIGALMAGTERKYGAGAVRLGRRWGWPATWIEDFLTDRWSPGAVTPTPATFATAEDVAALCRRLDDLADRVEVLTERASALGAEVERLSRKGKRGSGRSD
ncbi:MAG: hypothetical protein WAZ19_08245 [Anaerolineae bacterium]|jgi:ubiquinone biosynthesis protein UbiJ